MSLRKYRADRPSRPLFPAILGAFLLLGLLHAALFLHWGTSAVVPHIAAWVIPMTHASMTVVAACVAFLSFGRYRVLRDPVSFWTGTGFAAIALCRVFYVLAWPGLLPDGRAIVGHLLSTPTWIGMLALTLPGACLLAAVCSRWPGTNALGGKRWVWLVGTCLISLTVMNLAVVVGENLLPALLNPGGIPTPFLRVWLWAVMLLVALGAVNSTRYYMRTGDTLPGYSAFAWISVFCLLVSAANGGNRRSLLFFVDRFLVVGGFAVMLFGLLSEYVHLYRREQERARELEARSAELSRLKTGLEVRVEERTTELAAANKELEAFVYTVSHDLRGPLRHIMSYAELLGERAETGLDEQGRRFLQVITSGARQMDELIDGLLKLSRLDRVALSESDVNLGELVLQARDELAQELHSRNVEWQIGRLPMIRGDSSLLRSVMANLLSNAVKYTRGKDPAQIQVGSVRQNSVVICFVRDNGAGFDNQAAGKLFGAFQRLHSAQQFEGIGIGLASVRRIIQRHGGLTWAEGAAQQGATFYFSLPESRCLAGGQDDR